MWTEYYGVYVYLTCFCVPIRIGQGSGALHMRGNKHGTLSASAGIGARWFHPRSGRADSQL